eukprot:357897-Chlamydomonas_euryale.AAC.3
MCSPAVRICDGGTPRNSDSAPPAPPPRPIPTASTTHTATAVRPATATAPPPHTHTARHQAHPHTHACHGGTPRNSNSTPPHTHTHSPTPSAHTHTRTLAMAVRCATATAPPSLPPPLPHSLTPSAPTHAYLLRRDTAQQRRQHRQSRHQRPLNRLVQAVDLRRGPWQEHVAEAQQQHALQSARACDALKAILRHQHRPVAAGGADRARQVDREAHYARAPRVAAAVAAAIGASDAVDVGNVALGHAGVHANAHA